MSDIKEFYDDDAREYDKKRFTEHDWQDKVHQGLLKDFLATLPDDSRVLEIGCGTGRFTTTLIDCGFEVTAVDISQSMLKETHHRFERDASKPKLINGDVSNLPFKNNHFTACIMINVASHLPDPEEAFSEISRVIKKGGSVFSNFTNLYSPYFPIGMFVNHRGESVQEDVFSKWYSWAEIDDILTETGFEVSRVRGHMIPPRNANIIIDHLIKTVDALSRDSLFRFFAGNRFYHLHVSEGNVK